MWHLAVRGDLSHDDAEGEDVRGFIVMAAQGFQGKILAVAFGIHAFGSRPGPSQPKVGNLDTATEVDQNVRGLEIQVNVATLVDEVQGLSRVSCIPKD